MSRICNAAAPDNASNDSGVLAGILAGMERWESAPSRDEAVKAKVGSDLAPFLGSQAMDQLLNATSVRGGDLLSTVEPVVALFLGCRAASALIDHIVDHSILRAF